MLNLTIHGMNLVTIFFRAPTINDMTYGLTTLSKITLSKHNRTVKDKAITISKLIKAITKSKTQHLEAN